MPKIYLKPNSPEYAEAPPRDEIRGCDMPGCHGAGEHKAPKHRGLNDYHWFCLDHVREYNQAWNFFSGMSEEDVQDHIVESFYGHRPTWRYDMNQAEDALREKAWQTYAGEDSAQKDRAQQRAGFHEQHHTHSAHSPEFEAMAIMGLEPPVTLDEIKARYKDLAKKYHPDLNKGCAKSEDLLKTINMAYTILKVAYEEFEKLPQQ